MSHRRVQINGLNRRNNIEDGLDALNYRICCDNTKRDHLDSKRSLVNQENKISSESRGVKGLTIIHHRLMCLLRSETQEQSTAICLVKKAVEIISEAITLIKKREELDIHKENAIDQIRKLKRQLKYQETCNSIKLPQISKSQKVHRCYDKNLQINLKHQITQETGFKLKSYSSSNLEIDIKELFPSADGETKIETTGKSGNLGGYWNHLAIKNLSSYMIGSDSKGLKLVEDNEVLFISPINLGSSPVSLKDLIYIKPPTDCYLIAYKSKLFRKNIDRHPPYPFINIDCGVRLGACFRYSDKNQRLIINQIGKTISAVDLASKEVEIQVEKSMGGYIVDFRIMGDLEDRVVAVTQDGFLLLNKLKFDYKIGFLINFFKMKLDRARLEEAISVAVCTKNQFILVEIGQNWDPFVCSKLFLFRVENDHLNLNQMIDVFELQIGHRMALECYGYSRNHALWVGLSLGDGGNIQVYDHNTATGKFEEEVGMELTHQELNPVKILRFEDDFYYTGHLGKVMRLSLFKYVKF